MHTLTGTNDHLLTLSHGTLLSPYWHFCGLQWFIGAYVYEYHWMIVLVVLFYECGLMVVIYKQLSPLHKHATRDGEDQFINLLNNINSTGLLCLYHR